LNAAGTYTVTATLNGCAGTSSTIITIAPMASGLTFDGVNDEIIVPNSAQFNSAAFSIEAWIYPVT
jgi:PKD repeat protein